MGFKLCRIGWKANRRKLFYQKNWSNLHSFPYFGHHNLTKMIRMITHRRKGLLLATALLLSGSAWAQTAHERILRELNQKETTYGEAAKTIWNYAEVG